MKKASLFLAFVFITTFSFSQSKKELEEQIIQLQQKSLSLEQKDSMLSEKNKFLESELSSLKLNLLSITTTLNLMSGKMGDLEKTILDQEKKILALARKNDSLLLVNKGSSKEVQFVDPINEEDSILLVLQTYFAAKKWEERLSVVLKPESTKQMMKEYYATPISPAAVRKENILIKGSNFKQNEVINVSCYNEIFYIKKTAEGFKIDWAGTVGYNAYSFKTFRAINTSPAKTFRVTVSFTSYYNNDDWWAFSMNSDSEYASDIYVLKSSPEGKKISEILKDGKDHQLIVELKWILDDPSNQYITVSKFIQEGWSQEK